MPTYQYECRGCSHRFDKSQKMSEPALAECPECGGHVERLIVGGVGIILKDGMASAPRKGRRSNAECRMTAGEGTCCGAEEPCDTPPCRT